MALPTRITRDQTRAYDRLAQEELGIPSVVLMENAGLNAANAMLDWLGDSRAISPEQARVAVVCGGGNNGGDGYVIARHLANWSVNVRLFSATDPGKLKGDAATNHAICRAMGLPVERLGGSEQVVEATRRWPDEFDLVVDALLGTGFEGDVREPMATLIQTINGLSGEAPCPAVAAVDIPSGLDCDTGEPSNATIRADLTISFVAPKRGFETDAGRLWAGHVITADIGAPLSLLERA